MNPCFCRNLSKYDNIYFPGALVFEVGKVILSSMFQSASAADVIIYVNSGVLWNTCVPLDITKKFP